MAADFPLKLLLITFAGFVNRDQSRLIDYLLEENRIFRELHGDKRPRLNDDQRRRLAAKGKPLGRRLLDKVAGTVTPDTVLRWHRKLVAKHHTYPRKTRVGRPGLMKSIRELIVRMATENSSWGYLRDKKHLILDNDALFTKQFCSILGDAGCKVVRTAIQAPNMNAFAERFVQTVKRECLSKLILFGEGHLRRALSSFSAHYHLDRPHQGIGNERIAPSSDEQPNGDRVVVDERHGGLLRSYRRTA